VSQREHPRAAEKGSEIIKRNSIGLNCLAANYGCRFGLEQAFFTGVPVHKIELHLMVIQLEIFRKKSGDIILICCRAPR